jgi:hypothetical protein
VIGTRIEWPHEDFSNPVAEKRGQKYSAGVNRRHLSARWLGAIWISQPRQWAEKNGKESVRQAVITRTAMTARSFTSLASQGQTRWGWLSEPASDTSGKRFRKNFRPN